MSPQVHHFFSAHRTSSFTIVNSFFCRLPHFFCWSFCNLSRCLLLRLSLHYFLFLLFIGFFIFFISFLFLFICIGFYSYSWTRLRTVSRFLLRTLSIPFFFLVCLLAFCPKVFACYWLCTTLFLTRFLVLSRLAPQLAQELPVEVPAKIQLVYSSQGRHVTAHNSLKSDKVQRCCSFLYQAAMVVPLVEVYRGCLYHLGIVASSPLLFDECLHVCNNLIKTCVLNMRW